MKNIFSVRKTSAILSSLLFIIVLLFLPLNVSAASIYKPSTPEFTLEIVDNSYDVPPTYKTDEFTGKTVVDSPGYHVDNLQLQVTIKNQALKYNAAEKGYHLYYNIRTKGHFGETWREHYPVYESYKSVDYTNITYGQYISERAPQSEGEYTVAALGLNDYAIDAQIDVQVQALIGHDSTKFYNEHPLAPYPIGGYKPAVAYDSESPWSNTQTISMLDAFFNTTTLIVLGGLGVLAVLGSIVGLRSYLKKKKNKIPKNP